MRRYLLPNRLFHESILWYIHFSLRERGVRGSLALWQREFSHSLKYRNPSIIPRPFLDPRDAADNTGNHPYQGCYFEFIELSLSYLIDRYGVSSIIDIGAGRGRVLKVSAELGMSDITGIEINEEFSQSLSQLRAQYPDRIHLHYGDALDVYPSTTFDVAFLFNPFSLAKLQRLISILNERDVMPNFLICVNPSKYESALRGSYTPIQEVKTGKHTELLVFERV